MVNFCCYAKRFPLSRGMTLCIMQQFADYFCVLLLSRPSRGGWIEIHTYNIIVDTYSVNQEVYLKAFWKMAMSLLTTPPVNGHLPIRCGTLQLACDGYHPWRPSQRNRVQNRGNRESRKLEALRIPAIFVHRDSQTHGRNQRFFSG